MKSKDGLSQQKTPWNLNTFLIWTNRLEELEEVLTAEYYCYDQIHSVGLMNAEPNSTAEEIGQELIGKFLYHVTKSC